MTYYGAKELARSFRTVRDNTIKIAEEIPEEKYGFRPAEGCRSIAEMLVHIAVMSRSAAALRFSLRCFASSIDFESLRACLSRILTPVRRAYNNSDVEYEPRVPGKCLIDSR